MSMYGWVKNVGMKYASSLDARMASSLIKVGWNKGMAGYGKGFASKGVLGGIKQAGRGLGAWVGAGGNLTDQVIRGGTLAGAGIAGAGIMAGARNNRGRGDIYNLTGTGWMSRMSPIRGAGVIPKENISDFPGTMS